MYETKKAHERRIRNEDYRRYINGYILDVGAAPDPIDSPYGITKEWNESDGDGQYLKTVEDNIANCVYSSHSLEHMVDIEISLTNWVRVLKPRGYLYIVVPDYELYEKEKWPSVFNTDHKHSFSINRTRENVGRQNHFNICLDIFPILRNLYIEIKEIRLEDFGFDSNIYEIDQTLGNAECHIVVIGQKNRED